MGRGGAGHERASGGAVDGGQFGGIGAIRVREGDGERGEDAGVGGAGLEAAAGEFDGFFDAGREDEGAGAHVVGIDEGGVLCRGGTGELGGLLGFVGAREGLDQAEGRLPVRRVDREGAAEEVGGIGDAALREDGVGEVAEKPAEGARVQAR
jgi:hypothetical protein